MLRKYVKGDCFRLIPSRFPPIRLFENLLDSSELDAAYALESLTNDRLQDEVGNIKLVSNEDRVTGCGTTAIMAAFTHIGVESRFTKGRYGVYYAGMDLETALAESRFSRTRLLKATNERAQQLTMRCYRCEVDAELVDVREDMSIHNPDSFAASQILGDRLKKNNELGILYNSVRMQGGLCVAALRPKALIPPALEIGHFQFHWDGRDITHVLKISSA